MNRYSIVITVYNSVRFLEKCLESVRNQTYSNWELVLVNDGSTDGSESICEEFERNINTEMGGNSRVVYLSHENRGAVYSRERGICACTGEYVFFMDSDDWWEQDLLERVDEVIKSTQADIIQYGYNFKDEQGLETTDCEMTRKGGNSLSKNEVEYDSNIFTYRALSTCYSLWSRAFRRNLFDTEEGFYSDYYDVNMTNDLLAFSRPLSRAKSYCFTDLYLYNYRIVGSSLCHDVTINKICSYFRTLGWAEQCMISRNGKTEEHVDFFSTRLSNVIFDEYREQIYTSKVDGIKMVYKASESVEGLTGYLTNVYKNTDNWYKKAYISAFLKKQILVPKLLYIYSIIRNGR